MGVEGINEFASGPTSEESGDAPAPRPTDQEVHEKHQSELDAEREEHNRRRLGNNG